MALFGPITNPLVNYGNVDDQSSGLIFFLSNIIKLAVVVAGIFTFINLIVAGFLYISSGDNTKATVAAWAKINMSLIGLALIVASFAIAGVLGLVLFGDPTAILSPKIYGPGAN